MPSIVQPIGMHNMKERLLGSGRFRSAVVGFIYLYWGKTYLCYHSDHDHPTHGSGSSSTLMLCDCLYKHRFNIDVLPHTYHDVLPDTYHAQWIDTELSTYMCTVGWQYLHHQGVAECSAKLQLTSSASSLATITGDQYMATLLHMV